MKHGKSLAELAQEIDRQSTAKHDLLVPTQKMHMEMAGDGTAPVFIIDGQDGFSQATDRAHSQIATRIGIPQKYYNKMRVESPELLKENVNHWLHSSNDTRMVRTLDGTIRAFMSDRYKAMDNDKVAMGVLASVRQSSGQSQLQVISSQVTPDHLYINMRFPKLQDAVAVGDAVQMGVTVSNSEVGAGALRITPLIYRLVCTNGMVMGTAMHDSGMRRSHLGGKMEALEDFSVFTSETVEADDRALMLKIRDTMSHLSDPELFKEMMLKLSEANESEKIIHPVPAVEVLSTRLSLTSTEQEGVLTNLIRGDIGVENRMNRWGMANAVTRLANDVESFDRSYELMEMGRKVLDLPEREWETIAEAA